MSSQGDQIITFKYQQQGTASGFNGLLYKIIPAGIIEGGECTNSGDTLTISPMNVMLNDSDSGGDDMRLVVHVITQSNITVTMNNAKPYVVARFEWENSDTSEMEVLCVSEDNVRTNDVILCVGEFRGNSLEALDFTKRTYSYLYYAKEFLNFDELNNYTCSDFNVIPLNDSNKQGFYVSKGSAIIGGKKVSINGQTCPLDLTHTTSNLYFVKPTQGRCDLVTITSEGEILYVMGADDGTYNVPLCPSSCLPLATIRVGIIAQDEDDWEIKGSMIENYNIVNYTSVSPVIGDVEYDGGTPKKGTLYAHTLYI